MTRNRTFDDSLDFVFVFPHIERMDRPQVNRRTYERFTFPAQVMLEQAFLENMVHTNRQAGWCFENLLFNHIPFLVSHNTHEKETSKTDSQNPQGCANMV